MKTKLIYLLAFLVIGFTACDKTEDENKELSKEEVDAAIESMADEMTGDISGIMETEGVVAIKSLSSLMENASIDGRTSLKEQGLDIRVSAKHLYKMFVPSKKVNGRSLRADDFVFEEYVGVYDYNFDSLDFIKVNDSDVIELNFPTEGSTTLDAKLVISALDLVELTFEDDFGMEYTESFPTDIKAELSVDDIEQASLDLAIAYNNDGMPVSADIDLFLNPYSFKLSFSNSNTTNASIAASLRKASDIIIAIDLDVTKGEGETIESISGFVQYRTIKLQGSVTIPDESGEEELDPNDLIKLSLYQNFSKIGDIKFIAEEDGEPYLVYADGSMRPLFEVLEPVIIALEEELAGLFGEEEGGRLRK